MGQAMDEFNRLRADTDRLREAAWNEGVDELFQKFPSLLGFGWSAENEYDDSNYSDYVRADPDDVRMQLALPAIAALTDEEHDLYDPEDGRLTPSAMYNVPDGTVTAQIQGVISDFIGQFEVEWLISVKGDYGENWVGREAPQEVKVMD